MRDSVTAASLCFASRMTGMMTGYAMNSSDFFGLLLFLFPFSFGLAGVLAYQR